MPDWDAFARRAPEAGIFLDFDGCLSPIVPEPGDARPVRGAAGALARLARRYAVVAIITGRSLTDIRRRLRAPGVRYVGLHGLEVDRPGVSEAEPLRAAVERAAARLQADLRRLRGVTLEHKGLALAVHFRRAPDPIEAERLAAPLVTTVAEAEGLVVVPGRRILEIRPIVADGDKGAALRRLADEAGVRAALVVGDDVGDIPAFVAAGDLETAIRVAVGSAESPRALIEAADVVLATPAEVVALLRRLATA